VRSSYLYASNSVETKKEERLLQALEEVKEYRMDNRSDAPNWDEVKKLEERINRDLETLRRMKSINN